MSTRYILIDAGSHRGQSIQKFKCTKAFTQHTWEIYGFEPQATLHRVATQTHPTLNGEIFRAAVWIHNDGLQFYESNDKMATGHSVMRNKTTGCLNKNNPVNVDSIDFSSWIKKTFNKETDFIILKMDIEGAEYDVLEKMINDGSLGYISFLFIEWHAHKLSGFDKKRHARLKQLVTSAKRPFFIIEEGQVVYAGKNVDWFKCLDVQKNLDLIK